MQKLTLSKRTIQIMKNFASINPSLVFRPGNTLATVSPSKTVLAKATVEEEFESAFAIYDLSKLLSVLSLFDEPELAIGEKSMVISSGGKRVNYVFADLSLFEGKDKVDPYSKNVKLPSVDVNFELTEQNYADIMKARAVLKLPEVAVVGDGSTIAVQATDSKNPSGDVYAIDLGETSDHFKFYFKYENLQMISGDYKVDICQKGISKFVGSDVEYVVAVEHNSEFGK